MFPRTHCSSHFVPCSAFVCFFVCLFTRDYQTINRLLWIKLVFIKTAWCLMYLIWNVKLLVLYVLPSTFTSVFGDRSHGWVGVRRMRSIETVNLMGSFSRDCSSNSLFQCSAFVLPVKQVSAEMRELCCRNHSHWML